MKHISWIKWSINEITLWTSEEGKCVFQEKNIMKELLMDMCCFVAKIRKPIPSVYKK